MTQSLNEGHQNDKTFQNTHKKRRNSLEIRTVLLIVLLEYEMSGVAVQRIYQNSEKWWLCEKLLSKNDFEAVLAPL